MIRSLHKLRKSRPACPVIRSVATHFGVEAASTDEPVDKYDTVKISDPNEKWEILEKLGEGGFSTIYKAANKMSGKLAVAKIISDNEETNEIFQNEFKILKRVRHNNIVQVREAYDFDNHLWMIIEYCEAGSLSDIMAQTNQPLEEIYIQHVTREVLKALIYLNEICWIIHRDLKCANILLNKRGQIKLADFGVSAANKYLKQKKSTFTGSPYWISPEVVEKGQNKDKPNYDYKIDTWSLGITCIEMAEIQPPYSDMEPEEVMQLILKHDPPALKTPEIWSNEFVGFVKTCLNKNPSERPSPHNLFKHQFIRRAANSEKLMLLFLSHRCPHLFDDDVAQDTLTYSNSLEVSSYSDSKSEKLKSSIRELFSRKSSEREASRNSSSGSARVSVWDLSERKLSKSSGYESEFSSDVKSKCESHKENRQFNGCNLKSFRSESKLYQKKVLNKKKQFEV